VAFPSSLLIIPIAALAGFTFASMSLAFTALSPSMYFFNYFVTLWLTPMFLFSGVFYPITALPAWAQQISWFLPLTHVVAPARLLAAGHYAPSILGDILWLFVVGMIGFYAALVFMRRRLIK
jgi:lipooligosaccharide transport system permease protein